MIKNFEYYVPVKLVFGQGAVNRAGEMVSQYGKKALIVTTGDFFKESGLIDRLQGILKESGVESLRCPLGESLEADTLELPGDRIIDLTRRFWLLAGDLFQQLDFGAGSENPAANQ